MALFVLDTSSTFAVPTKRKAHVEDIETSGNNQSASSLGAVSQHSLVILAAHDALPPALRQLDSEMPMNINPVELLEEWHKTKNSGRGVTYEEFCAEWRRYALKYLNDPRVIAEWPNGRPILRDLPKWKEPAPRKTRARRC